MYLLKEIYKHLNARYPVKRTCQEIKKLCDLCEKEGLNIKYYLSNGNTIIDGEQVTLYSSSGELLSDVIYSPCCYGYGENLIEIMWRVGPKTNQVEGHLNAQEVFNIWKDLVKEYGGSK